MFWYSAGNRHRKLLVWLCIGNEFAILIVYFIYCNRDIQSQIRENNFNVLAPRDFGKTVKPCQAIIIGIIQGSTELPFPFVGRCFSAGNHDGLVYRSLIKAIDKSRVIWTVTYFIGLEP
ncbi:MAG: hypothetical protein CVU48_00260 [Candidatus Cloacimonetes bacterium HGW-Cloacimonetes-1]|nr:MAG: hypothetical protein CVU48_00260 [Candidatus Cloacimonetes bacterium HGW-Cloacimonetes-1]